MGEHRQHEDDLDAELPSAQISSMGERRRPDGSAYWSEPEPATRDERVVAWGTAVAVALLLLGAVAHLFLLGSGLVPFEGGAWGFPDYSYIALMVAMSTVLVAHSSLSEDALRPRTIIVLATTIGGIGTLLALVKGWLTMFGAAFAEQDWVTYSVFGAVAISILPFALPFAVGIILLRNDFEPVRWRIRAVSLAVASSAVVIALAALVPRWAGFS